MLHIDSTETSLGAYKSPTFLTVDETAELLRMSPVTLGRWRIDGKGPAHTKFGRRVVYAHSDLMHWARKQRRASTSEQS